MNGEPCFLGWVEEMEHTRIQRWVKRIAYHRCLLVMSLCMVSGSSICRTQCRPGYDQGTGSEVTRTSFEI